MLYEYQYYKYHICGYFQFAFNYKGLIFFETKDTSVKNVLKKWKQKNALSLI